MAWLAGAIRVAQELRLPYLTGNPDSMPDHDPALPMGCNAVKRRMALGCTIPLTLEHVAGADCRIYIIDAASVLATETSGLSILRPISLIRALASTPPAIRTNSSAYS